MMLPGWVTGVTSPQLSGRPRRTPWRLGAELCHDIFTYFYLQKT